MATHRIPLALGGIQLGQAPRHRAYVCDSPPMVANSSAALAAIGFTRERIRCERF
jgi:ferredoxin-NADP reductase